MKLLDLKEKRAARVAEMQGLVAAAEQANRDLADNEVQRFDQLKEETRTLDQSIARAETLAELERRADADPVTNHGGIADLERRVSVLNVIRAAMEGRALTGAEAEYSQETARRLGRSPQGVFVPLRALESRSAVERRVNLTTTAPEIIPTDHRPDLYIGPFREKLVARQLGARVLTGLRGDLSIPKFGSGLSAAWVSENEAIPESNMSFDAVTLSPKHAGAITELSRQLIQQSSPDVEQLVRDDLAAVLAGAIDAAMIDGGATAKEPTGITRTSGVLQASLGDLSGSSPTPWNKVLTMMGMLEDANITGPLTWLLSPKAARALKVAPKVDDGSAYLLEGGRLADIPAFTSARVPNASATAATAILGDFSQIILALWSELDILVNPYAEGPYRKGNVLVRGIATVDVAVRHPAAFVVADDITVPA